MEWAKYVFQCRIKTPPGNICVLLFDAPDRVPATKDLTHVQRSTASKRKRCIPLSADTVFGDNIELPEWSRVTSSKHVLPALWMYLIDALARLCRQDPSFSKTVYVDAPLSYKHRTKSKYMDGGIHCIHQGIPGSLQAEAAVPVHRFGEGDLKTYAWVNHLRTCLKYTRILVWSTDLDNICIFAHACMRGTDLIGNKVEIGLGNKVVPKKAKELSRSVYEIIDMGDIAVKLGCYAALFRSILVMGKTDFNVSVDQITTERMLKTYFSLQKSTLAISLDADRILNDVKEYRRFRSMCFSKALGNTQRKQNKPFSSDKNVEEYLARCRWIRDYWLGLEQQLGGPLPKHGWKEPSESENYDLGTYKGRVRLVPIKHV